MAEPDLVKLVERWRDQFDYLETGTKFLQEVCRMTGKSEQELFERYPYWSATIITTGHELDNLANRLEEVSDRLRFPVILASNQEMRSILDKSDSYQPKERQILPKGWRDNLNQQVFTEWKTSLRSLAEAASRNRKEKERELQRWRNLTSQVQSFFSDYPHHLYQEWKRSWQQSIEAVERLDKAIREVDEQIKECENQWQLYHDKLREEESRALDLSHRIQNANEYFLQKNEKEKALKELRLQKEKIAGFDKELNKLKSEEQSLNEIIEELNTFINENKMGLFRLQGQDLYLEVRNVSPLPARSTLELLRRERRDIQSRLRQQQAGREQLESEIMRYESEIQSSDADLKSVQSKAHKEIDPGAEFPIGGEEMIQRLGGFIRKLRDERDHLQNRVNEVSRQIVAQEAQIETKISFFSEKYPNQELDRFSDDLESVREKLLLEEETFLQKKKWLENEELRLRQAIDQLNQACNLLEKKNERYQFNHSSIKKAELSEEERMSFPYDPVNVAQRRISSMEKAAHQELAQFERLNSEKEKFKQFCQQKIQDIRLREKAISGIENKREYHDVQEWAQRMSASIANGIRLLEEDLRGHDEQLQHFIVQIHDHLKKVAVELLSIPKKTSVKVDNYWKPIYSFTVPEWKDEFGKQAIRSHIDWMLTQLDSERFKDQEGKEDFGKMKKWIFTSLQTKQLLHIVMGNDTIKVKCRKVSNDGKVSGALTSWEESNKWSGGEKWSKNMTLFLGILNYLAEKRQHIVRNGKRFRTVIMDNPFGKASSEHVLDPVFFIAEQLGFQLIALTALAEGKFIRDYFPIVYSCRLRESVTGDASIMTKEREIKQAYFRDHDPYALLRLSEHEQLSLFT